MTRTHTRPLRSLLTSHFLLIIASLFFIGPIIWLISMSFKDPLETFALPPVYIFKPTLESYFKIFHQAEKGYKIGFWLYANNSILIAGITTIASVTAAGLGAYSISRFNFKGRKLIAFLILSTRMLPPIAAIVPMFLVAISFGLLDTRFVLIIAYTALNLPFAIWMLKGFMDDIPTELEHAAMVDGCTRVGALYRIVLPLIVPGLAATSVFVFMLSWNEFALALMLTSRKAVTLPLYITSFMTEEGIHWGPMSAAATLILTPAIIFIIFAQQYLVKGLTLGAVKG